MEVKVLGSKMRPRKFGPLNGPKDYLSFMQSSSFSSLQEKLKSGLAELSAFRVRKINQIYLLYENPK